MLTRMAVGEWFHEFKRAARIAILAAFIMNALGLRASGGFTLCLTSFCIGKGGGQL